VDESAFRATRGAIERQPCVFEKALLARCADCSLASRHALAEREAIGCGSPIARANCATLLGMLRERCAFALKLARRDGPVPHAIAMRLQCGGLRALARAMDAGDARDVHALVAAAGDRHGALSDLPWPGIVAAVAAWEGRRRREVRP
jgi:hypothetical protein